MTKNYDPANKKEPSLVAKEAEKFPSPPKKDGTPDPQNILAKQRQEKAMAEAWKAWKAAAEGRKGGTKGNKKKGGSSSGSGKKA